MDFLICSFNEQYIHGINIVLRINLCTYDILAVHHPPDARVTKEELKK